MQVFSCEICEIFKKTFLYKHLLWLLLKLNIIMLQLAIYQILEQEVSNKMRTMRKKLNKVMLQLSIYYILEQEISAGANANIAKIKGEKQIVFVVERWIQCLLLRLNPGARGKHLTILLLWVKLPECQSLQLALSTQQMSFSICSWCSSQWVNLWFEGR